MDKDIKYFVGLDVHKDSIAVGVAQPGRAKAHVLGSVPHDMTRLARVLAKLGAPEHVHVVYEAGPTGYGLHRWLVGRGYTNEVIAPSLMPRRAGERVKTDRRDSLRLAELNRAGELTAVHVPESNDEAMRDLSRTREDAVKARVRARQQLSAILLRQDKRYPGKTPWTKSYYTWLGTITFDHVPQQLAFTEAHLAVQAADQQVQRLTQALVDSVSGWRYERVVKALMALRGIEWVSAIGLVAEIGDMNRFAHPRQLMGYLGLVPSEHSSGARTARGSITKAGNSHARRLLVEASWHYRHAPRIGKEAHQRQRDLPEPIRAHAWKAQQRLCARFARLQHRGVGKNKTCVAVARELSGFIWAIARAVPRSKH